MERAHGHVLCSWLELLTWLLQISKALEEVGAEPTDLFHAQRHSEAEGPRLLLQRSAVNLEACVFASSPFSCIFHKPQADLLPWCNEEAMECLSSLFAGKGEVCLFISIFPKNHPCHWESHFMGNTFQLK